MNNKAAANSRAALLPAALEALREDLVNTEPPTLASHWPLQLSEWEKPPSYSRRLFLVCVFLSGLLWWYREAGCLGLAIALKKTNLPLVGRQSEMSSLPDSRATATQPVCLRVV